MKIILPLLLLAAASSFGQVSNQQFKKTVDSFNNVINAWKQEYAALKADVEYLKRPNVFDTSFFIQASGPAADTLKFNYRPVQSALEKSISAYNSLAPLLDPQGPLSTITDRVTKVEGRVQNTEEAVKRIPTKAVSKSTTTTTTTLQ